MVRHHAVFPDIWVEALVYETIAFVIFWIIAYLWYGHFKKTTKFVIVSFIVSVVYYIAFHWIFSDHHEN